MDQYERTRLLLHRDGMQKLQGSSVAVFGVGGVGGYVAEALARSGIGRLDLFDHDTVSLTNLNRQIIATHSTIGRVKVEVLAERLHDIVPDCDVRPHAMFYVPENADEVDLSCYDYVVDAVDTVVAKLELITRCHQLHIPVISAMGAGNKLDPSQLCITDITKTHTCPLARVMRLECRKRGIDHFKVAWSTEPALKPDPEGEPTESTGRRATPGSTAFVPASMGLLIASQVVRDLIAGEMESWHEN